VCVLGVRARERERQRARVSDDANIHIYIYMLGSAKLVKAAREWTRYPKHGRGERENIFCSPHHQVVLEFNTIHSSLPPKKTKPTLFPSPLPVSSLLSHKRLANSARTWRHVLALGFGCTPRYLRIEIRNTHGYVVGKNRRFQSVVMLSVEGGKKRTSSVDHICTRI